MKPLQLFAIALSLIVVADFLLLILRKISPLSFWIMTAFFAAIAFVAIPRMNKP